ncbi:MAG: MATE family efflux transporter [Acholeplasmataceae bacterium]
MNETTNKNFYQTLIKIAIPIFFSQLMGSLLGIIDTFMVTELGDDALSAVGIGSQFLFLSNIFQFGLFSGLSIFIAQFYGSKSYKDIYRVFWIMIFIGLLISFIFLGFVLWIPESMIHLFNLNEVPNQTVINLGVAYLSVIGYTFITSTIAFAINMLARNVGKVLWPSIFQIFGVILNTFLNYGLINGYMGFPQLGVKGAALATLISSGMVAILSIIYLVLSHEKALKVKLSALKGMSKAFVKKLIKTALPVLLNEGFWGLGMTAYLVAYGFIGDKAVGSVYLSNQINNIFWVGTIAIANAAAVMLGNKLGENKLEIARLWEKKFRKLGFILGIVLGIVLFAFAPLIVPLFGNLTDEVTYMVVLILRVYAVYAPIKFLNAITIVGTLRSGGDTKFALFAEILGLWGVGVPLAFILSYFTKLDLYVIIIFVNFEEIMKFIITYRRATSGKWINNLTHVHL